MFDYLQDATVLDGLDWLEVMPAEFDAASEVWEMVIRQKYRISIWKMQAGTVESPLDWYTLDFYSTAGSFAFDFHDDYDDTWTHIGTRWLGDWDQVILFVSRMLKPTVVLHDL